MVARVAPTVVVVDLVARSFSFAVARIALVVTKVSLSVTKVALFVVEVVLDVQGYLNSAQKIPELNLSISTLESG